MTSIRRPLEAPRRLVSIEKRSGLQKIWREVRTLPVLPSLVLVVVLLSAIFGPGLAPLNPSQNNIMDARMPPFWEAEGSWSHILGTDSLGRDVFTRLIYGARVSLFVAFATVGISGSVGTMLGMVSGYFGGRVDALIMRITEAMLSMPSILIAIAIVGALGTSMRNVIAVIVLTTWAAYARIIRGETLRIRESDFVRLAVVAGSGRLKILFVHILPNMINTLIVLSTLSIGQVIIYESSLSFLGLGVPLGSPSWGSMLAAGRQDLTTAWWLVTFPGVMIMVTCLGTNLMGDWLRDRLDPRRQRQ